MRCSFWHDQAEELAATWNESDALSSFDQQDQQAQGRKIVGKAAAGEEPPLWHVLPRWQRRCALAL